jgi:hypothetical protein
MPELINPREEKACDLRAKGKTQLEAYNEAFDVPADSKANNSSRFFRRDDIKVRVAEIKRRRAVLADLDDAWVLKQLKAIAKQGELIGNANLDDYFVHTDDGRRIGIELTDVPRAKMAALDEVLIEQTKEGPRDDPTTIVKTKIKLKSPTGAMTAAKLIGDWLGMWAPQKIAPTNPDGDGPATVLMGDITDTDRAKALAAFMARVKMKPDAA